MTAIISGDIEMILPLFLLGVTVLTQANPFHKYPYVFLLDVGNEELEKVNTEQIRVSKQGGSIALRYPAIGNGDDIAHVRVSGIDFGTDLKATIVDGGPGYQYVVLLLMGNPGVNFDAVITIQTVPSDIDEESLQSVDNDSDLSKESQKPEDNDANDSAEDLNESGEASQVNGKENAELTQESSNVYSYAVNEALSGYGNSVHSSENNEQGNYEVNEEEETDSSQQDIHIPYKENEIEPESDLSYDDDDQSVEQAQLENDDYPIVSNDQNYAYESQDEVGTDLNEDYESSRANAYKADTPYQEFITDDSGTIYIEEADNRQSINLEDIIEDDYDEDESEQYNDQNNNYFIDRNEGSAVDY